MPPKRMRKDVEEAVHLRNQQLMNAALRGDVEEVTSLIERGADVVGARDIAPFSKGDKLSVLAALLLQGTFSKETLAVAQVLLRHGASLNDVMPLPNESHFAPHLNPLAGALDSDAAAAASSTVAATTTVSPRQRPTSAQRTRAATPMSNAESRTTLPDAAAGSGTTPATTLLPKKVNARTGTTKANDEDSDNNNTDTDQGTVLHYLVALGDHTHLMQLLMMAGQPTNTLPHSLLRHVELFLTALTNYAATGSMTNMDGTANNNNSSSATNAAGAEGKAGAGGNISARSTNTAAAAGAHSGRRASRVLSPRGSSSRGGPRGGNNANNANNNNSNTGGGGKEGSAFNYVNEAYALAAIAATIRSTSLPVLPSMTAITAVPTLEVAESGKDAKNAPNGQQQQQLQSNGLTRRAEGIAGAGVEKKKTSGHNTTVEETAAEKGIAMRFDLEARTTRTGLTPLELALRCGDVIAARLLLFYGAMPPFLRCVNGLQTRLARACSLGDVVSVERLLDMGDSVTQISTDGRYTLVHYAVGQPAVLRYLVQRGLSLEAQNAFGETALASLIRHGTGRNAEYAIRETPQLADAAKLATLPSCAVRNYILTPLPPLVGMGSGGVGNVTGGASGATAGGKAKGAASSGRGGGGGSNSAGQHHHGVNANAVGDTSTSGAVPHRIGGPETWPWWSFTSLPTIDLIHNLIEAGADVNGLSNNYDSTTTSTMHHANYDGSMATGSTSYNTRTSPAFAPSDIHGDDGISEDEERFFYGQVRRSIVIANESENDRLLISPEDRDSAALEVVRVRDIAAAQQQQVNGGTAATSQPRLVVNPPLSITPLMYAIVGYHPELIRKLVLEYHAAVMARDSQGACALHYAAMCRHASVMSFLLSAPVLALTSGATTNTNAAATASSLNGTAMPAETEIDINATDNAGRTPLHYAAAKANVAVVALLLAQGTALQANRPDQHGLTPLHVAVQANHINVVELLVRHCDALFGAWPGMTSNISSTPLGIASGNNNGSFFAGLTTTASNASVNSSNTNNNGYSNASPNVQASSVRRSNRPFGRSGAGNSPGTSALSSMTGPGQGRTTRSMSASSRSLSPGGGGPAGAMMMMLSGNTNNSAAAAAAALAMASNEYTLVDPESRDTEEQATALEMAIKQRRSAEIVRLLLCEAHASHQIDSGLSNGGSLLHRAVWDGELLYVRLLLDHFANPNEVDNADCTPLMLAIRQTSFVHVNAETGASHTITGAAATTLSVQMIEALLQAGAAPQLQSAVSLDTALHAAARRGERDILYRVFHDPSAFARRMTNMSEHVFFAHTGTNTGLQRKSSHHNNYNSSTSSNPNIIDGNAPQQQQLVDGVTRSLSQSETTLPTQTNTAHGSLVGRKARERLEQRRRLAAETENRGEHMNGYSSPSESEPSKASLASQQQYHRRHSSIPYKTEGGEYMNQTQPYKGNNEENGEEAGYGDATRPSFTQRGSNGSSSYEGEHEFALMLLRPRSTFCITDAAARTPLHLLCAHSDATRQQHVLPFIKELVLCPAATMMFTNNTSGVVDKEREECVALCEMMDAKGRTALHEACLALFVEAIEVLLAASPQLVGFVDAEGHTPLHDCVRGASDIAQCAVLSEESNNTNNSEVCETGTGNTPARVTRAIALLHDAVQRCSPLTLRGFPAPFTAFTTTATGCGAHNASSESASVVAASVMKCKRAARTPYSEVCKVAQHVSITSLLKAGELRGVAQRPNCATSIGHDSKAATIHTRGGTNVVQCWSDYANLTDSHARTALLLAGEVGHIAAARQLLQLAQQQ